MVEDPKAAAGFSLKRWSQLKHEAARAAQQEIPASRDVASPTLPDAVASPPIPAPQPPAPSPLPPVDTLTFESDFSAFMQPKVAEATRRAALKKLFGDPSFNVMDGLDIYVGDYTQPDPMPAGMLERLAGVYAAVEAVDVAPAIDAAAPGMVPETTAAGTELPLRADAGPGDGADVASAPGTASALGALDSPAAETDRLPTAPVADTATAADAAKSE